jgi:hypothetical protein
MRSGDRHTRVLSAGRRRGECASAGPRGSSPAGLTRVPREAPRVAADRCSRQVMRAKDEKRCLEDCRRRIFSGHLISQPPPGETGNLVVAGGELQMSLVTLEAECAIFTRPAHGASTLP